MMREISLHILDIMQNSVAANASLISISITKADGWLTFVIKDNGCGMTPDMAEKVVDPFVTSRTTRKVGLGIPLFKEAAEVTGGNLEIRSTVDVGTELKVSFKSDSIDRIPLGDFAQVITLSLISHPDIDLLIELESKKGKETLSTKEMKEVLGDVPINAPEVIEWLETRINESIVNIFGGVLNEIIG